MKIVDRYVLSTFIKNYLISFMVLIGMYIALDMVFNISSITQTNKGDPIGMGRIIYDIADFYFYQAFFFFVQLSGVITVAAAAFTLMRLSRFNELTALLAAGVPLLRVAASVIVAGAILNLVLLPIDQEYVIPKMIPKLIREHNEIHQSTIRTFAVHNMQDKYGSLFSAAMYYPGTETAPAHLQFLDVIERQDMLPVLHVSADSAVWNATKTRWDLTNGVIAPIAPPDREATNTAKKIDYYRSDITPEEVSLNLGKDYIQFLPIARINQLLNTKGYATLDLLRTKHLRFAQPISNVILLLLAISTVLTRQPEMLKMAAFKCMNLTGLCMATVFICYQLAGSPPSMTSSYDVLNFWPALMAWMPIFIFGPTSVYLLDHLKS